MFFRYVPNPTKVLAELLYGPKQHGNNALDVVKGKIVAGDPADLDVLVAKGTPIDTKLLIKHTHINIYEIDKTD